MAVLLAVILSLWSVGILFAVALCRAAARDHSRLPDHDTHEFGLRA